MQTFISFAIVWTIFLYSAAQSANSNLEIPLPTGERHTDSLADNTDDSDKLIQENQKLQNRIAELEKQLLGKHDSDYGLQKPDSFIFEKQEWVNLEGKKLFAPVVRVELGRKVVFLVDGNEVPYSIDNIAGEGRDKLNCAMGRMVMSVVDSLPKCSLVRYGKGMHSCIPYGASRSRYLAQSPMSLADYSYTPTYGSSGSKTVHVRSYSRSDGTHVHSHMRSSPRHK